MIRFDELEARAGGKVSGELVSAVLFGYYENMDMEQVPDITGEKKLELFHWSFEAIFELSQFQKCLKKRAKLDKKNERSFTKKAVILQSEE